MNYRTILLIISAITVSHCFYLAISVRLLSRKIQNKLLTAILILFALRTGKSVVSLLAPGSQYFTAVVGLLTMAGLGPLFLFYVKRLFTDESKLSPKEYLQFLPGVFSFPLLFFGNWSWLSGFYYFFTAHLLVYSIATGFFLIRKKSLYSVDDLQWRWSWYLLGSYLLLSASFIIQLIFYDVITYTLNVVIAAFIVYALSIYAQRRSKLFITPSKRKQNDAGDYQETGSRIEALLEHDEIFTDADLTISKLAGMLKMPPYRISKVINQFFNTSFPELVLRYRLKKAEQLLLTKSEVLSIEGIAYESGFNSLSVFYSSFKKVHKVTPAQYRRDFNSKGPNMKIA